MHIWLQIFQNNHSSNIKMQNFRGIKRQAQGGKRLVQRTITSTVTSQTVVKEPEYEYFLTNFHSDIFI